MYFYSFHQFLCMDIRMLHKKQLFFKIVLLASVYHAYPHSAQAAYYIRPSSEMVGLQTCISMVDSKQV